MRSNRFAGNALRVLHLAILAMLLTGCGDSNEKKTLQGLQEENKVLREKIADLQKQITDLKALSTGASREWERVKAGLQKDHEDRLAKEKELHRARVAQLDKEIADLRLQLGAPQRERIALQEILDVKPRVQDATSVRKGMDVMILLLLVGVLVIVLTYVAYRYRSANDRLNLLTMREVAELRQLGSPR
jgi:hypothetical protein